MEGKRKNNPKIKKITNKEDLETILEKLKRKSKSTRRSWRSRRRKLKKKLSGLTGREN